MDSNTDFDYDTQLPTSNRARGRFGVWVLVLIAAIAGLVVGEVYPMHAFGPSTPNGATIKLKTQRYVEAVQTSSSLLQRSTADPVGTTPAFPVQKPEGSAQLPETMADAIVPLPLARPRLQIVSRYYYVRTVDQGDADGKVTFRIERRPCKSPNLPPVCFEPLSVRQKTILNDF